MILVQYVKHRLTLLTNRYKLKVNLIVKYRFNQFGLINRESGESPELSRSCNRGV